MAKFEGTGEIEIIITPKEFMQNCSSGELLRLKELVKDEFDLVDSAYQPEEEEIYGPPPRSESHREFNHNLVILKERWLSITKKDEEKIKKLTKKYE